MDQLPELTSPVDLSLFVHLLPLLDMIPPQEGLSYSQRFPDLAQQLNKCAFRSQSSPTGSHDL